MARKWIRRWHCWLVFVLVAPAVLISPVIAAGQSPWPPFGPGARTGGAFFNPFGWYPNTITVATIAGLFLWVMYMRFMLFIIMGAVINTALAGFFMMYLFILWNPWMFLMFGYELLPLWFAATVALGAWWILARYGIYTCGFPTAATPGNLGFSR